MIDDCIKSKLDRMDALQQWAKSRKRWILEGHEDRQQELVCLKAVLEILSGDIEA